MQELETINRYLGGHGITISGLKAILSRPLPALPSSKPLLICEIGSGGGDNLSEIKRWCVQRNLPIRLIGIDINQDCINYARDHCNMADVEWITGDYRQVRFREKPDIIFSSLFCHHFKEEELIAQLHWMKENAVIGFFISDLHRHPLAYYSIRWLTRFFSHSYLVKNDAPLSVLRGFRKREWKQLLSESGMINCSIHWRWAFRWLIVRSGLP
jgi:2-polyprenyl-3-methyl-5-hydroxy-6-metoxy-1,4-benzoquinol methylase